MKLYETTVIFDPGLEEARVNEEVERVTQPIAQAGGEVIEVQRWGKRKLAYMIRKRRDGTYVHVKHKSPPELIGEMDRRVPPAQGRRPPLTVVGAWETPTTAEAAPPGGQGGRG